MKSNETKLQKWLATLLRGGRPAPDSPENSRAPVEQEPPLSHLVNPLARISEYLSAHGLSPLVRVRFDEAAGDFVLEDDDGCIHAPHYAAAVRIIDRIWL